MPGGLPGGGVFELRFDWYINTTGYFWLVSDRIITRFHCISSGSKLIHDGNTIFVNKVF